MYVRTYLFVGINWERFHDYCIQEEQENIEIGWFATENSAQPDPGDPAV